MVAECFFNLSLEDSHILEIRTIRIQIGTKLGFRNMQERLEKRYEHIYQSFIYSQLFFLERLASGSLDKTVCLFTLSNDRLSKEHTYRGHGDSVDQLVWHPTDPDLLATASGDRTGTIAISFHFISVFFHIMISQTVLYYVLALLSRFKAF